MIGRGRHNDILLFEMTEQDLLDTSSFPTSYQPGNVLLFDCSQDIQIGLELARADDLACALEFLGEGHEQMEQGVVLPGGLGGGVADGLRLEAATAPAASGAEDEGAVGGGAADTPLVRADGAPGGGAAAGVDPASAPHIAADVAPGDEVAADASLAPAPYVAADGATGEGSAQEPLGRPAREADVYFLVADEIRQLNQRIEQRDGLLSELSDKLRRQREENDLLSLLLEQTTSQLALDAASRDELMDDLKEASANTMLIETNLEQMMEEKLQLEQELAEKITALIETSMVNDDLRRRLDKLADGPAAEGGDPTAGGGDAWGLPEDWWDELLENPPFAEAPASPPTPGPSVTPGATPPPAPTDGVAEWQVEASQVLTMSGGKQIHIYHEFPTLAKRSLADRLKGLLTVCIRLAAATLLLAALTLAGSVLATSLSNGISYGQALDLIIDNTIRLMAWG